MLDKLGIAGVIGLVVLLAGLGLIASQNVYVAAGVALVLSGVALVVRSFLTAALGMLGMGATR